MTNPIDIANRPCATLSTTAVEKSGWSRDFGRAEKYNDDEIRPRLLSEINIAGQSIAAATSPRPEGPSHRDRRIEFTMPNAVIPTFASSVRKIRGLIISRPYGTKEQTASTVRATKLFDRCGPIGRLRASR